MSKLFGVLKPALITLVIGLLLFQPVNITALSASDAKQLWYQAKEASRDAQEAYSKANLNYAANKTEANNQKVISTGKDVLNAALDEAEAWLNWVKLDVEENPEIPNDLKKAVRQDVATNLAKVDALRGEVDAVQNRVQLVTVFLKMVGKYLELVTDVARNTGLVWVHIANDYADTAEEYEAELRLYADGAKNEDEIVAKLDAAKSEIVKARTNIDSAKTEYLKVKLPGNPILSFSNGNQHLRLARNNLLAAQSNLKQAYKLWVGSS